MLPKYLLFILLSYRLLVLSGNFEFEAYVLTFGLIMHTIKEYQENVGEILLSLILKINGKEKIYEFEVFFEWVKSDVIKFQTEKIIKFTDFGIKPPSIKGFGVFGKLVTTAKDELKIKGEVLFKVKKEE